MAITYNGAPFPANVAEPFVTISDEPIFYADKWGVAEQITLTGTISGCGMAELATRRNSIASFFSLDHKTLVVGPYSRDNVVVNSINFDESNYIGTVPFSVTLSCYPDAYFLESQGVVNPSNEWNFQETDDSTVLITHKVSATGIENATSAIVNAKSFVDAKKSTNPELDLTAIISFEVGKSAFLVSENETVDRLTATVSLNRTYIVDQENNYGGVLRYLINKEEKLGEYISASISGSFSGGLDADFSAMRTEIKGISFDSFLDAADNINSIPLEESYTEDESQKTIAFSFKYDNNPDSVYTSSSVEISRKEDGLIEVNVSGVISGRGSLKKRFSDIEAEFSSLDIFSLAETAILNYDSSIELSSKQESYSSQKNPFGGEITFSATYTDKAQPPEGFDELNFSVSVNPSIQKVSFNHVVNQPDIDEPFEFWDLDYHTRGKISVSGSGSLSEGATVGSAMANLTFLINDALNTYIKPNSIKKTTESDGYSLNGSSVNFSIEWSFDVDGPINSSNLKEVASLI